jgi:hypothetical protein
MIGSYTEDRTDPPQAATAPSTAGPVTVAPGSTTATVTWHRPTDDGGADLGHYTVRILLAADGSPVTSTTVAATILTTTVTGLTSGTAYTAEVSASNTAGLDGPASASDLFTTTVPAFALTGLGAWKTADPATGAPMICLIWQITGTGQDTVSGELHYQLAPTAGGTPDPATDWAITFNPDGNHIPGTDGEYSWCADTAQIPASTSGTVWTPIAFTARNTQGDTVTSGAEGLTGLTITDPDGTTDPARFTTS